MNDAQECRPSGQAAERARERHREYDELTRLHARVPGRVRVGSRRPDFEAERRPEEQEPDERDGRHREPDAPMGVGSEDVDPEETCGAKGGAASTHVHRDGLRRARQA